MTTGKRVRIIAAVAVVIIATAAVWYHQHRRISTDDAQLTATTVAVAAKVPGYVVGLAVTDNQTVRAGEVLLQIDDRDYRIARDRALAALKAAQAAARAAAENLEVTRISAPAGADAAAAQLSAARARWADSQASRQRMEDLFRSGAVARQQLDDAVAAEEADRATVAHMEANLRGQSSAANQIEAAENAYRQALAQVGQAEAELARAEVDLAHTKVVAPFSGRIANRSVDVGDYVQTGQQLGYIVADDLWVVANFKETQLGRMKIGQKVEITVDAYPDVVLIGTVDSFQPGTGVVFSLFPPQNATGNFVKTVQRVPVKIIFDQPPPANMHLGPGMSVVPVVLVD
ncbi:MAG: HlyD family secretion protein [Negativicutes bacterium]|nr:HlyD family secretion protein [Negativicutes bacterium]